MQARIRAAIVAMALAGAPVLGVSTAAAQALPPAVGNPLQQAQRLAQAGNTSGALQQIGVARAAASTPQQRTAVAQMAAYVHSRAGNFAAAAQELEKVGAGPRTLAPYYYRAGNLDKAIELAKRAGGPDMQVIIAQSYLRQGKTKDAITVYQQLIRTNGPRTQWLQNLASAQFKDGDKAGYIETVRQIIRLDPSPGNWRTLLLNMRAQNMSNEAKLALYQLMLDTGNMTRPEDFQDFAKLAILDNQPGSARSVLNKAVAAKAIDPNDAMTARLIQAANQRAAAADAELPSLPRTGEGLYKAGLVHFGAERWPAAAASLTQAIAARAPNAEQARMLAGMALLRGGNVASAKQQFAAIPAGSEFKDIADIWSLYASTKG